MSPTLADATIPPAKAGWYWQDSDDGPLFGPFATQTDAINDWWEEHGRDYYTENREDFEAAGISESEWQQSATNEHTGHYRRAAICCDVFDAELILENLEDKNEESVHPDNPPSWPPDARDLELRLAAVLKTWIDERSLAEQFRGMEETPTPKDEA